MKQKPWEAEITTSGTLGMWYWRMDLEHVDMSIISGKDYFTEERARAAARRAMEQLGLVERKAKAGKDG